VESHALSRDGRWLAYSSNLRGTADIFKIPIDGGTPIPVTTAPTDEFAPAWSPDGQELAYEISGDLWLVSSDGGKPLQLTSGPEVDLHPAWAPNGLGLAFTSNRSPWTIWLLGRERVGGPWAGPRQLSSESCFFPQWVPDGSGVWCNERDRMLLLITLDGVVRRRVGLAAQGIVGTQPVLSPDGATLYSVVTAEEGRGVWSWPVRGGAPRLLMRFDDPGLEPLGGPGSLTVGPDGLYLTLVEQESDIWVMDLVRGSAP
jgi:WD40 repeat protein